MIPRGMVAAQTAVASAVPLGKKKWSSVSFAYAGW